MSRLYNKTFKVGFVITIAVFGVLNVGAYLSAQRDYEKLLNPPIAYAPAPRFPAWGIPFRWDGYNLTYVRDGSFSESFALIDGIILNFLTIAACGFLVGLLLRRLTGRYE